MSLGDPYIDAADLKAYLGDANIDSTLAGNAIDAATSWVNDYCARDFNTAGTTSDRIFAAESPWLARVDDFSTTAGLVIVTDPTAQGTFNITWDVADYTLEPLNGIEAGIIGRPYRTIRASRSLRFPGFDVTLSTLAPLTLPGLDRPRPLIRVTAKWGWAAVPKQVKQATRILAAEFFRLKDAPLGVAGFNEFGPIRVREVPQAAALLDNLRHPTLTGPLVG